jgi:hypothetical protein
LDATTIPQIAWLASEALCGKSDVPANFLNWSISFKAAAAPFGGNQWHQIRDAEIIWFNNKSNVQSGAV